MWLPLLDAMRNHNGPAFAAGMAFPSSLQFAAGATGLHPDVWTQVSSGSGDAWFLSRNLQDFADAMTRVTG